MSHIQATTYANIQLGQVKSKGNIKNGKLDGKSD